MLCDQVAERVAGRTWLRRGDIGQWGRRGGGAGGSGARCRVPQALGDQGLQRILGFGGVEVEDQPVPVGGDRRQGEDLGQRGALEVHHQPHDARGVLADADAGDVGVVRLDLRDQFAQFGIQVDAFDVHRQPRRRGHEELLGGELLVRFDGHAGVVLRRPYAHRDDARAAGDLRGPEQKHQGSGTQQPAPRWAMRQGRGCGRRVGEGEGVFAHSAGSACTRVRPRGVPARSRTSRARPSPSYAPLAGGDASICRTRSAAGSNPAAFSGHSASFRPGPAKMSRKPASSHSRGSPKR